MKQRAFTIRTLEFDRKEDLAPEQQALVQAAMDAALQAYAPYSQYQVGAAALLANGSRQECQALMELCVYWKIANCLKQARNLAAIKPLVEMQVLGFNQLLETSKGVHIIRGRDRFKIRVLGN